MKKSPRIELYGLLPSQEIEEYNSLVDIVENLMDDSGQLQPGLVRLYERQAELLRKATDALVDQNKEIKQKLAKMLIDGFK